MADKSRLRAMNPWWQAAENIHKDDQISRWQKSGIRYEPRLLHAIKYDFEPDNTVVYTLRGPRQVGKTTLIKLQIRNFLIGRSVCPWNVFYYSFDLASSKSDLADVVESYMRMSKARKDEKRSYLFLDEVTSIDEWQKGVKWLVDGGMLKDCTVLATGSRAARILGAKERLPGRRGATPDPHDRLLVPMKFAEFVENVDERVAKFVLRRRFHSAESRKSNMRELAGGRIPEDAALLHDGFVDDLDEHLREYMIAGGTPKIVGEKIRTGSISSSTYSGHMDGVRGDWAPRNAGLLAQFGGAVAAGIGSSTSWSSLQRQSELKGWSTVQDYALFLKDMALLTVVRAYGEKKRTARLSKEKKLYFQDPFYLHMFRGRAGSEDPFADSEKLVEDPTAAGKVAEGVVADHLVRCAFGLSGNRQEFDYSNHVFFWKDEKNREVDFVLHAGGLELPLEVRYRKRVNHRRLGGLASFLSRTNVPGGLVLSRDDLQEGDGYAVLPASVFLMLI